MPGFPIRKSADQIVFANPRSLSQLITSFIASVSQGIRHAPFITSVDWLLSVKDGAAPILQLFSVVTPHFLYPHAGAGEKHGGFIYSLACVIISKIFLPEGTHISGTAA